MNITEKSERCPITSVARPIDQQRLVARITSISTGLPKRTNAARRSPSVSANATRVARSLSWKAATISSFWSAGLPVTPTAMSGKSRLSDAITPRIPSMARWSPVKLPRWVSGSALELFGIDPVGDPLQRDVVGAQLTHEAIRVDRRLRQGRRVDHDGDAVEIPELALVLGIALDVRSPRRQQRARRGGEGEGLERVDDRHDRHEDGDEDGRHGPRAGDSHQRAEWAANQPGERQPTRRRR